ncbi:MAG: small GTP-binding protein [Promethearchaeota archaeon CR_4]|nr:MAG: small GTP-binding protein [Candidatus Lokiarchaeota archaeon CR_4]
MSSDAAIHVRDLKNKKAIPAKIIIIGDPAVGKTSLIKKYVKIPIDSEYLPTVGAHISKQPVKLLLGKDIVNVALLIWDIAGQDVFRILHKVYYNGAKGIILVFDLTKPQTLTNITRWQNEAIGFLGRSGKIPMILVGNKSDLKSEIKISKEEVTKIKELIHIPDYFETSALTGTNVTEMFYTIAERVYSNEKH